MIRAALNREVVKTQSEIMAQEESAKNAERTTNYSELDAETARDMEAEREAIMAAEGNVSVSVLATPMTEALNASRRALAVGSPPALPVRKQSPSFGGTSRL